MAIIVIKVETETTVDESLTSFHLNPVRLAAEEICALQPFLKLDKGNITFNTGAVQLGFYSCLTSLKTWPDEVGRSKILGQQRWGNNPDGSSRRTGVGCVPPDGNRR